MSINADYCPTVEGDDPKPCQSGCGFQAAPGGSYCCGACYFSNGVHGPLCKRIPAPAPWASIGVTTLDAIDAMLATAPTSNGAPAAPDEVCPTCGQRTNANLLEESAATLSSGHTGRVARPLLLSTHGCRYQGSTRFDLCVALLHCHHVRGGPIHHIETVQPL